MIKYRQGGRKDKKMTGDPSVWAIQDKITEIRGKLTLKQRDQEAYYVFSQQQIKENEQLIKSLRSEIHEKRVLMKMSVNADDHVIREGFKKHRESQLAMQRYTVDKAKKEKNEHVFDKVGQLDAARHERKRKIRKRKDLALILEVMKRDANADVKDGSDQRLRVLSTSIDKMQMKYSSACFIQRTYLQILRHLERENLKLPGRLRALEQSILNNRSELDGDLFQIQVDARKAYSNTKSVKEKMEEKIMKEKRRRDRDLAEVRRKFKKMNQKEEKEYRPRRRITHRQEADDQEETSASFWEKVREFWMTKRAMDDLQEKMSVPRPQDIAYCFQKQINRQNELKNILENLNFKKNAWMRDLGQQQELLNAVSKSHHAMIEEFEMHNADKLSNLDCLQNDTTIVKEKALNLEAILTDVINAISTIHQKTSTCDWIPKHVRKRNARIPPLDAVVSSGDLMRVRTNDVAGLLSACGDKLKELQIMAETFRQTKEDLLAEFPTEEGQELLVTATSSAPGNTRVCIADEDDLLMTEDFFGDDDDTNDKYLSREAIKKSMLQFTENQTSRKKKRRAKKE
ncbi:uncharacterized protein LOC120346363 [Styela clava]